MIANEPEIRAMRLKMDFGLGAVTVPRLLEHFRKNCSHKNAQNAQKSFNLVTFVPFCGYGID